MTGKRKSPVPYVNVELQQVYAEQKPGFCAMCGEALPPPKRQGRGRRRLVCELADCRRVYNQIYRIDRTLREGGKPRSLQW